MQKNTNKRKFSKYFYNVITYLGVSITISILVLEVLLFAYILFFTKTTHVYTGVLTYLILPCFLILGLILIPLGALWKRKAMHKSGGEVIPPRLMIDLAIAHHRNALFIFIIGTTIFLFLSSIISYKAFHFTESVQFCGMTCHQVMKPEYTTYLQSPHAKVKCVDCHIGAGADWYVRAKISGVRQVFATLKNTYHRPIETPVHNLRPAKDTCQHCHWPEKFYSSFELIKKYYPSEEEDYPNWYLRMLIKIGGNNKDRPGVHTHMYLNNEISYVADESRQKMHWVKTVNKDGQARIFTSPDSPYKDVEPPAELIRKMDCIDCHNRPTHQYKAPNELVNEALDAGKMHADLPSIKYNAMAVLSKEYASQDEAELFIRSEIIKIYQKEFSEEYDKYEQKVSESIEEIVRIYRNYFFPNMKARWDKFPNNVGHLISPGCFRCHDGEHSTKEGGVITKDCKVCHTIIEQGPPGAVERNTEGLNFRHPFNDDDDEIWKEMNCFECHTGN